MTKNSLVIAAREAIIRKISGAKFNRYPIGAEFDCNDGSELIVHSACYVRDILSEYNEFEPVLFCEFREKYITYKGLYTPEQFYNEAGGDALSVIIDLLNE